MPMLPPGLTSAQTMRLHEQLRRLTGLPAAVSVYIDADRLAGRWMLNQHGTDHTHAAQTIAALLAEHRHEPAIVAFLAGMAHGVRLGRTLAPKPPHRSKWISEEYKQLSEDARRTIAKVIRKVLREERRPAHIRTAAEAADDVALCRQWASDAGRQARRGSR